MTNDIGAQFRALHVPGDPVVIANAWDIGSARLLEALGIKAIATTSSGHALTQGRMDGGTITRDEALAHAQEMVRSVSIPVSGDFENGFGEAPETVADTIRMAADVGLAGCSIEDTALPEFGAYDFDLAVERVRAGAAAAKSLSEDFVFIARADGVMMESYDMDEAIRRVQAFAEAGADGVYVPVPPGMDALRRVVDAVDVPVNALVAGAFSKYDLAEFAQMGVARISVGGALCNVAYGAAIKTARDMITGNFQGLSAAVGEAELEALLSP